MLDSKTVIWEYDVVGEENFVLDTDEVSSSNETLAEYLAEAEIVRRSVIKVRSLMARGKHTQWWLNQKYPKDTARLESIMSMIDTWSMAHSFLVVVVAITQVTLLKRFFNVTPTSTQLKMRI